jgi:hypothetical protein
MIGQERLDAALGHQLPTQCRGVQQPAVGIARALHTASMNNPHEHREHHLPTNALVNAKFENPPPTKADCSTVS